MDSTYSIVKEIADSRHLIHADHNSSRPLSADYEYVGLSGEIAFGMLSGLMPDFELKPKGDNGVDFTIPLKFTVDIKTARKAIHLIHEVGKGFADIYVLAEYEEEKKKAKLIGWCFGKELMNAPSKDFGYGIVNHYIHRDNLRDMDDLSARIVKVW